MSNATAMNSTPEGLRLRPQACASQAFVAPAFVPSALVAYVTEDVAGGGAPGTAPGELSPRGFTRVVLPQAGAPPHGHGRWQELDGGGEAGRNFAAARHPGALLREDVVPAFGLPAAAIARLIGVTPRTLQAILGERAPVTAAMALRLGKLCGNRPELWLGLQARYELARAGEALEKEIAAIPTLAA